MERRGPQKPFFTPPATAKFALALGSDGETIHPPPVTKSVGVAPQAGGCDGDVGHVISACACETMTSASGPPAGVAGSGMGTCSALTSMVADRPPNELDCSLIIPVPALSGRTIVWFGAVVTVTGWPPLTVLMVRLASSELPLTDGLLPSHWAASLDIRKSAVIVVAGVIAVPATVKLRFATEASERLALPWPTVVAWGTSAPLNDPILPSEVGGTVRSEASCAPPVEGRSPVSAIEGSCTPSTEACTT